MTAVLEAVDSKYRARVHCTKDPKAHVDCSTISRNACDYGRKLIPGIIDCDVEHSGNDLVFHIAYTSPIDPDEIAGKLYAVVLIAAQRYADLEDVVAVSIDINHAS